mmetsp:Transcript_25430/g.28245  ORF Transcript_25430/g.28245 Transcript_25430/m.28245 type:complete len:261 (+) Transcript_25430:24-806(+)
MIFDPFDEIVHSIGLMIGKPDDQSRMLIIFFLAYPLAYIFRFLRGKYLRHAYSIIVGVTLHLFMFREGALHFWGLGLIVYAILSVMDRKKQPWVVFAVCLIHLSGMHINRFFFDFGSWSLDATTFLMPLISRLSSLGFVYADGEKKTHELTEEQNQRKVEEKPSLIEILSYISYPASNLCGPFFEFRDYKDFIEENGRYKNIPSSFGVAFSKLFQGIILLGLCVLLPLYFDTGLLGSEWFANLPYFFAYLFWTAACFGYR